MFSPIELACFTVLPLLIAIATAAIFKRWAGFAIALAICLSFCATLFVLQTRDNCQVTMARIGHSQSAGHWLPAARQTATQFTSPKVAHHWVPAFMLAALLGSLIAGQWLNNPVAATALYSIVSATAFARFLWTSIYVQSQWSTTERFAWLGGLGLVTGLIWWKHSALPPANSRSRLFGCGLITACLAATLFCSGSLRYGTMTAALACGMGGAWLMARASKGEASKLQNAWSGPVVFTVATMLILGCAYSELMTTHALMIAASLVLVAFAVDQNVDTSNEGEFVNEDEQQGTKRSTIRLVLALLPAVAAAGWAIAIFVSKTATPTVNPYDAYK